jgi:hypothetical protein
MENTMQATKVNLLDPAQEPTDEQLGGLMSRVGDVVRARRVAARHRLKQQVEQNLAETKDDEWEQIKPAVAM